MNNNPLDFLLDVDRVQSDLWSWATVTGLDPLRVRLDNDSVALEGSPMSLVDPQLLRVGSRVYVQLKASPHSSGQVGRRAVIIGPVPAADPTPAGTIVQFAGENSPAGWLMCRGQDVSRETYSTLYGVLGDSYGAGDGTTTFTLPDFQGIVPVGMDPVRAHFDALGLQGGEETHTLSTAEMPAHKHTLSNAGSHTHPVSNTGESAPHNNMQPYLVVNFIIKT